MLELSGIDNSPVFARFGASLSEQETALFHKSVLHGDDYVETLHRRVTAAIDLHGELPVVRFADGEFAFYDGSLKCNGLYQQAESVEAIRAVLPAHVDDLRYVAQTGILAPLIFPGNLAAQQRGWRTLLRKRRGDDSGLRFLDFLSRNDVTLTRANYVPFYVIYAWLSSARFAAAVDGKKLCIVNSDIRLEACVRWFERFSSRPEIVAVPIPASLVATQWASMQEGVMRHVPPDADLCLVGAGVGALPVCSCIARTRSIPAIDAGHVLNMMNDLETKSAGQRLYTIHR